MLAVLKAAGRSTAAILVGIVGGSVFYALHLPLPWTLGALVSVMIASLAGRTLLLPPQARLIARPAIGVIAGSSFTAEIVAGAVRWWGALIAVCLFSFLIACLGFLIFRKIGKFDRTTAFFACAPGGLAEMTLTGGILGGDVRQLTIVHVLRIVVTVISIPLFFQLWLDQPIGRVSPLSASTAPPDLLDIAVLTACAATGYFMSRIAAFPGSIMVYALVLSATAHVTGISEATPPPWITALMQVVVGAIVGSQFAGVRLAEMRSTVVLAFTWGAVVVALTLFVAGTSSWLLDWNFEGMVLALAPGGMVEMTILTLTLGIDVAFVVTCQVFRILLVTVFTPLFFRWVSGSAP